MLSGSRSNVWLTGEMSHHEVLDAVHAGTTVILAEHSNSERGFLRVLERMIREGFVSQVTMIFIRFVLDFI